MLRHQGDELLNLHLVNAAMDRQEYQAVFADPCSVLTGYQFDSLAFGSEFKPKVAGHNHRRAHTTLTVGISRP